MHATVYIDGFAVLVDDADLHILTSSNWRISGDRKKYVTWCKKTNGKNSTIFLHRLILAAQKGQIVDHINGESTDNRRCNLRIVTARQNTLNARKITARKTASRFKGVSWNCGRWVARIRANEGHITIGRFKDEVEAAAAYDLASIAHHKEYGCRNFFPLVLD